MAIIRHGSFRLYQPEADPENPVTMVPGILFARNTQGLDFYEAKKIIPDDALVVLTPKDSNVVVGASKGQLMAFPSEGQVLYSIHPAPEGITPEKACRKTLDPETGALT